MARCTVKKSEMTIGLYLSKAAQRLREAEDAMHEAEELARRARNVGHPQGPEVYARVSKLHERTLELSADLTVAAYR
jgi:hypothetical protein